jgi:hypothetical protein
MTSIIKVDNLQNQCGANIINENAGTITIGASGDTVTLAAGASQSGFGRSGSVNWDTTPKTTGFTAVSGNGYFCDTTSAAFTVTLPATPAAGDIVAIADYNGTATANNITVGRNSSNINGGAADFIISKNYAAISFVYVDATAGWRSVDTSNITDVENQFIAATGGTILTCGDFKTHVFTGPGTFTVTSVGTSVGSNSVEYLVVAGGGAGGADQAGAGGAGGFRQNFPSPTTAGLPVTATAYPISVGGGGAAGPQPNGRGNSGTNSIFSTITSAGGGGGGGDSNGPTGTGLDGGSGGGSGSKTTGTLPGGAGNTPPTSPPQGNPGGAGNTSNTGGGGGGGAGASGGTAPSTGFGGDGSPIATTFFGPTSPSYGTPGPAPGRYFAGGGGGGTQPSGNGGAGGGGAKLGNPANPGAGTTNTGGGGGGGNPGGEQGGAGGSGIVLIRYKFQ